MFMGNSYYLSISIMRPLFSQNILFVICPVHNIHNKHFWSINAIFGDNFQGPQIGGGKVPPNL